MTIRSAFWGFIAATVTGAAAFAQTPCSTYTVRADDTLREISGRAYGNSSNAQSIYDANRYIIGSDPAKLAPGTLINIPCDDGTISTTDFVPYAEPEDSRPENSAGAFMPFQGAIRIAVDPKMAPFSGRSLEQGGMVPELVEISVKTEDAGREINLIYVEGLNADLEGVFGRGRFDIALPVYMPDCSKRDMLEDTGVKLCRNFYASRAIYEVIVGMYSLEGSQYAQASTMSALSGARICRPKNSVDFDLRQAGLQEPDIKLMRLNTASDCVIALMTGNADVISMSTIEAEKVINASGQADKINEIGALSTRLSLHAVTPKNNPLGRPYLSFINNGFRKVIETGQWFAVAAKHIRNFQQVTQ